MKRLTLALLGGFRATTGSGVAVPVGARKARALLAYLASHPGKRQPRDHLASLLWDGADTAQGLQNLRQTLLALRRALPRTRPPLLVTDTATVTLGPGVDVDVFRFERLVAQRTPAALRRALALYQGELLGSLRLDEGPFDEWLRGQRARLRECAVEALERLSAQPLGRAVLDEAIEAGRRLLALDPAQEPVHRALMRLHVRAGRRTEALKQYQVCVDVLRKELGVEPERSTTRLHEQIAMRSDSPPAPGAPQARGGRAPVLSAAPAPLVGRQPELARLRRALDEAAHGRGSLVTVRGEAGIGKTRLIQELVASAAKQGARVVVGRCFESEQILPFGPWVEILRTEAVRPALDQVAVGDARRRTELARLLPELAPSSAAESSAVDNYLRIFDAVTAVIGALAAGPPTVLVLEDLHWADGMSTRLLAYVARRVRSWPLLLIASLRDEALPASPPARRLLTELDHEEAATPLPLALLAETETRDLVRRLAPARTAAGAVDRLSQQVWRLSDGHPFMVVETMRALQGGASPSTGERLPLAERIRQVIRERFERVGPRSRRLAEVAAVVGRECEVPLLRRAAGVSEAGMVEGLEELVRHRLLQSADDRVAFTHDRIREVVYADLLAPRRRMLHHSVARALEATADDRPQAPWGALGHHYREAGAWAEAVLNFRKAGALAATQGAHHAAIAHRDQALAALARVPERRDTLEQGIDLRFELGVSLQAVANFGRVATCFAEAERMASVLGDEGRLGWASLHLSFQRWITGDPRGALPLADKARAIGERLGDAALALLARLSLGAAHVVAGDSCRGEEHLKRAISSLHSHPELGRLPDLGLHPLVLANHWLTLACSAVGDFDRGIRHGSEALRIAEVHDLPYSVALACWSLGNLYSSRGRHDEAIRLLERGLALALEWRIDIMPPVLRPQIGLQLALTGRLEQGLSVVEEGLSGLGSGNAYHGAATTILGRVYAVAGRWNEARSAAELALARTRAGGFRADEGSALWLLGHIAGDGEPLAAEAALAYYQQALALADELGMRPLRAHCLAGLARLYRRTGRLGEAGAHRAAARALFNELGMSPFLPSAKLD